MRDSIEDLNATIDSCVHTLQGVGVGTLEDFQIATRHALACLELLEARGVDITWLLCRLADAESSGMHCRVLP